MAFQNNSIRNFVYDLSTDYELLLVDVLIDPNKKTFVTFL